MFGGSNPSTLSLQNMLLDILNLIFMSFIDLNSVGRVVSMANGVATVSGLHGVLAGELSDILNSNISQIGCKEIFGVIRDLSVYFTFLLFVLICIGNKLIIKNGFNNVVLFSTGVSIFIRVWDDRLFVQKTADSLTYGTELLVRVNGLKHSVSHMKDWNFFKFLVENGDTFNFICIFLIFLPILFFLYSLSTATVLIFHPLNGNTIECTYALFKWFIIYVFYCGCRVQLCVEAFDSIAFSSEWCMFFIKWHTRLFVGGLSILTVTFFLVCFSLLVLSLNKKSLFWLRDKINARLNVYRFELWFNRLMGVTLSSLVYTVLIVWGPVWPYPFNQLHEWAEFLSAAILAVCLPISWPSLVRFSMGGAFASRSSARLTSTAQNVNRSIVRPVSSASVGGLADRKYNSLNSLVSSARSKNVPILFNLKSMQDGTAYEGTYDYVFDQKPYQSDDDFKYSVLASLDTLKEQGKLTGEQVQILTNKLMWAYRLGKVGTLVFGSLTFYVGWDLYGKESGQSVFRPFMNGLDHKLLTAADHIRKKTSDVT